MLCYVDYKAHRRKWDRRNEHYTDRRNSFGDLYQ
jgi:hypothetical protein